MRQLIDEFGGRPGAANLAAAAASTCNLDRAQQEVDLKTYELLKEEIDFDCQAFQVYLANAASHKSAISHQQNLWQRKLLDEARAAADAYLDQHAPRTNSFRCHAGACPAVLCKAAQVTAFIWEQGGQQGHDPGMAAITAYMDARDARMRRLQLERVAPGFNESFLLQGL